MNEREIQYKICDSIDLTKLGIILEQMVRDKIITEKEMRCFKMQASVLRTQLLNTFNEFQHAPYI